MASESKQYYFTFLDKHKNVVYAGKMDDLKTLYVVDAKNKSQIEVMNAIKSNGFDQQFDLKWREIKNESEIYYDNDILYFVILNKNGELICTGIKTGDRFYLHTGQNKSIEAQSRQIYNKDFSFIGDFVKPEEKRRQRFVDLVDDARLNRPNNQLQHQPEQIQHYTVITNDNKNRCWLNAPLYAMVIPNKIFKGNAKTNDESVEAKIYNELVTYKNNRTYEKWNNNEWTKFIQLIFDKLRVLNYEISSKIKNNLKNNIIHEANDSVRILTEVIEKYEDNIILSFPMFVNNQTVMDRLSDSLEQYKNKAETELQPDRNTKNENKIRYNSFVTWYKKLQSDAAIKLPDSFIKGNVAIKCESETIPVGVESGYHYISFTQQGGTNEYLKFDAIDKGTFKEEKNTIETNFITNDINMCYYAIFIYSIPEIK